MVDDSASSDVALTEDKLAVSELDFAGFTGPGLSSTLCFLGTAVGSGVGASTFVAVDCTGVDKKRDDEAKQDAVFHCDCLELRDAE